MSRIANYPVAIPKGVEVTLSGTSISIKGPLGTIARPLDANVSVERDGEQLVCKAVGNSRHAEAMSGTIRALLANMVNGVSKGFEKKLALVGVGYRAQAPSARRAHPSEEHFLPLFVALGAAADDYRADRVYQGIESGALAMDSYCFGPA